MKVARASLTSWNRDPDYKVSHTYTMYRDEDEKDDPTDLAFPIAECLNSVIHPLGLQTLAEAIIELQEFDDHDESLEAECLLQAAHKFLNDNRAKRGETT